MSSFLTVSAPGEIIAEGCTQIPSLIGKEAVAEFSQASAVTGEQFRKHKKWAQSPRLWIH